MNIRRLLLVGALAVSATGVAAQPAPQGRIGPDETRRNSPEAQRHFRKAARLAGDFYDTGMQRLCNGAPRPGEPVNDVEPARLLDNFYYVGTDDVGTYVVSTTAGLILIDTLNNSGDIDRLLVPSFRKLGLDLQQLKYILLTHGHGDHYGGANRIRELLPGVRVVSSEADWAFMAATPGTRGRNPPAKDMVLGDGGTITLGDTTVTAILTPGHTPGTLSYLVPVKDNGRPHTLAIWGGNSATRSREQQQQMLASLRHFDSVARAAHADAEATNHPRYAKALPRIDQARSRKPGEPSPFIVGEKRFARFTGFVGECLQGRIASWAP